MRKNRMMRLASVLLVCVLLTTSVISGTFAKYTTSGAASDKARVAKFGVTVTATKDEDTQGNNTLFKTNYDDTAVSSEANVAIVAPGTSGALTNFVLAGTPEVDVKVWYKAELTMTGWEVDGAEYCPIIITVNGVDYQDTTVAGLKAKVEGAINDYSNTYDANVNLAEQTSNDLVVSWRWEFVTGTATHQTDALDTELGDQAAEGNAATIKLDVTCTVDQVD